MLAQESARILVQCLHIVCHHIARQHAKPFNQLKRESLGQPGKRFVFLHFKQRLEQGLYLAIHEMLQSTLHFFGNIRPRNIIDKGFDTRLQGVLTRDQFANRSRAPHQSTLFREINFGIWSVIKTVGAQMKMRR